MKILKKILIVLSVLLILIPVAFYFLWFNEINSIISIKELRQSKNEHFDGYVYKMNIKGSYYFEDFIKQGGASNDADLLNFISSHITKGLINMGYKTSKVGCSSFTAKTENGKQLFGRNYDMTQTNTCIVFTEKTKKRHATISTVDLQFIGIPADKCVKSIFDRILCLAAPYAPLDGMNDAGLSCAIYMSFQGFPKTVETNQATAKPDITSTTMLRMILDYADDVDEAVSIARQYDLHDSAECSFHYMVADKTGRSAILEWVPSTKPNDKNDNDGSIRELKVTYNNKDSHIGKIEGNSDFQCITNFIIQPGYYELSTSEDKVGADRYSILYETLTASKGLVKDENEGMKLLQKIGQRHLKQEKGTVIDRKSWVTIHSIIYNLTDKNVLWVSNENHEDKEAIFTFSL